MRSKRHLCDSCTQNFPECDTTNEDIVYGNGVGNDNVMECQKYQSKELSISEDIKERVIACLQDIITKRGLRVSFEIINILPVEWGTLRVIVKYKGVDLRLAEEFNYKQIHTGETTITEVCDFIITSIICTWNARLFEET
jgi:hypothetical protein